MTGMQGPWVKWECPKMGITPIAGWFISWKIRVKGMIRGSPILGHLRLGNVLLARMGKLTNNKRKMMC